MHREEGWNWRLILCTYHLEWICRTILSCCVHFLVSSLLYIQLLSQDKSPAQCQLINIRIFPSLLTTVAAWHRDTDARCAVGGSPEAVPRPHSHACYCLLDKCSMKGEPSFYYGDRRCSGLCVERVPSQKEACSVSKIEIIVFTVHRVSFSLCRQQTRKGKNAALLILSLFQ